MSRSLVCLLAAGLLLSTVTGCHRHHRNGAEPIVFVAGAVAGAAIVSASVDSDPHRGHRDRDVPTVIYVSVPPGPPQDPPRDRMRPPEPTAPFDGVAARSGFAKVDLSHCKSAGAPTAHGHAKVSFNPSGEASKVVVDEPTDLSPSAAKCIGDALGTVTVPPFAGSYVIVGTSFYVR